MKYKSEKNVERSNVADEAQQDSSASGHLSKEYLAEQAQKANKPSNVPDCPSCAE